jgi:hypothetical protein
VSASAPGWTVKKLKMSVRVTFDGEVTLDVPDDEADELHELLEREELDAFDFAVQGRVVENVCEGQLSSEVTITSAVLS